MGTAPRLIFSWWLIALVCVAVNWSTLSNGWSLEDPWRIVSNPGSRQASPASAPPGSHALPGAADRSYRPLTSLSYSFDCLLGGGQPGAYHATNLLLATLCSVWLFLVLRRLLKRRGAAFLGGMLFAVLPVHTEAVASISWGRAELLSTWLLLVAWHLHLVIAAGPRWSRWLIPFPPGFFFLALLASETKWTFPLIAVAGEFLVVANASISRFLSTLREKTWPAHAAAVGAAGTYIWLRIGALGEWMPAPDNSLINPLQFESGVTRALTGLQLLWRGFLIAVFPANLSHDYSWRLIPTSSGFDLAAVLSVLVLAGWIAAAALAARRLAWLGFGLCLYVLAAAPVTNLFGILPRMFAEHTLYWPSVAVAVLFGGGVKEACQAGARFADSLAPGNPAPRRWLLAMVRAGVLVVLVSFAVVTVMRNPEWRDTASLVRADYPKHPASAVLNLRMGALYLEKGQYDLARRQLLAGFAIHPGSHELAASLATALLRNQDPAGALRMAEWAVRLAPGQPSYQVQLGIILAEMGRIPEAETVLQRAMGRFPNYAHSWFVRGLLRQNRRDYWGAEQDFARAAALDPGFEPARRYLDDVRQFLRLERFPSWFANSHPLQ